MKQDNAAIHSFTTISQLMHYLQQPAPLHPLIAVVNYDDVILSAFEKNQKISIDFYKISFKTNFKGQVKYGLFPVWFLNTKWNGQTYSFAMNGQTGHLIGDLPVGKTLAVKYWFKHHIPLTLIMAAIVTVLRLKGVI